MRDAELTGDAVAIMHATDGARRVARELPGQVVQSLDRVPAPLDHRETDAEAASRSCS